MDFEKEVEAIWNSSDGSTRFDKHFDILTRPEWERKQPLTLKQTIWLAVWDYQFKELFPNG